MQRLTVEYVHIQSRQVQVNDCAQYALNRKKTEQLWDVAVDNKDYGILNTVVREKEILSFYNLSKLSFLLL